MPTVQLDSSQAGRLPLIGKIALVTGASSGIGRAIAIACAEAGADVAITYHKNKAGAHETARVIEGRHRRADVRQCSLADPAAPAALAESLRTALGRVDIWINNAGADILTGPGGKQTRGDKLQRLLDVDLRGTILASWAAAELMQQQPEGGLILNMSWDLFASGFEGVNPQMFAAVKAGVRGFSQLLARSVAPKVRVNVLAPGWIDTAYGSGLDEASRKKIVEQTPLKRWGTPEDVAQAAVFLASEQAKFLTGQTLMINGGTVM